MTSVIEIPDPFWQRMEKLLGSEFPAFRLALEGPRVNGVRVNTLKMTPAEVKAQLERVFLGSGSFDALPRDSVSFELESVPWCQSGWLIPPRSRLGPHPLHAVGAIYLQEPSAWAVSEALAPCPGERVLDLCAAPGGKATHLAGLLGSGLLVANEPIWARARVLNENLERLGVRAVVTSETPERLSRAWPGYFDRVLVDAPCSGEGMFRKDEMARREWSVQGVLACARRQKEILQHALELVRPGGVLAYSTCTFAPEENEQVIAFLLKNHPELELLEMQLVGVDPGRKDWTEDLRLERAGRIWPHRVRGEGHFLALLVKHDGEEKRTRLEDAVQLEASKRQLWRRFTDEFALRSLGDLQTTIFGGEVQELHPDTPSLRGLKVLRAGAAIAFAKPGRFEPTYALAHLYPRGIEQPAVDLDFEQVAAFMRGELLHDEGEPGWVLLRAFQLGLAWGKRVAGLVKNHLPKNLRVVG